MENPTSNSTTNSKNSENEKSNTKEPNPSELTPSQSLDRETVVLWNQWLIKSPYKNIVLKISNIISPQLINVFVIGLFIYSFVVHNADDFFRFLGVLLIGVIVFVSIKYGINRRRPFLKDSRITRLDPRTHKTSFPSGHSFWVSLIFLFVCVNFGLPWWVTILLYDLSLAVSLCRIALGAHYPTDLMMGHLLSPLCLLGYYWLIDFWYLKLVHFLLLVIFGITY
jgi:membrane-associated phospholipid phosphatase